MPKVQLTIPGSPPPSDDQQSLEEKNKREVDQARLNWQTRRSKHLEYRMKWRRFYREAKLPRETLDLFRDDAEKRIVNLGMILANPVFLTGDTWTKTAELKEETEAVLGALKEALSNL